MTGAIRVLLADDHPLVRSGIRATLAGESDVEVVGEATDGNEAQRFTQELKPDVILLDLSMPGPSPLETIEFIRENCAGVRVLVLSAYDDDTYVRGLMRVGVAGYLLKDEATEALTSAVRTVYQGGTWFSRSIVQKMFAWQEGEASTLETDLTKRDQEILRGIAQGWDNRRLAAEFNLAEQTVRNYVSRIYEKLNLHSRAEVVVWARKQGFAED